MIFGFAAATVQGCTVPVFRYALDRWPAEIWTLEAPRSAFTSEPLASALRNLGGNSPLNLAARPWPDTGRTDARLSFPDTGEKGAAWTGPITADSFLTLTDSPARRELARRILAGDSLVWVTVLSSDAAANDALTDRLKRRLAFVQTAAQLPQIDPGDPSSTLGPGPELKLQFSQLAVSRSDPAEAAFIAMLAGPVGSKLLASTAPFAAVVFGRGRVLGAWSADVLTDERLDETNLFITRACSCEAKSLHPGWDLLMKVDWDAELRNVSEAGGVIAAALPNAAPVSAGPAQVPIARGNKPPEPPPEPLTPPPWLHLAWLVPTGVFTAIVVIWRAVHRKR